MSMHTIKDNTHVFISVGCPKGLHGAFHIEDTKIVCDLCDEDITQDFLQLYDAITKMISQLEL